MAEQTLDVEEAQTSEGSWLRKWQSADFSWAGLAEHPAWQSGNALSLQEFLRRVERASTDDDLKARGLLIECERKKPYHVLFIPDEWARRKKNPVCDPDELARTKEQYWSKLQSNSHITDHFQGTITGAHLPASVEQRLVGNTRASFEWVRFSSEVPRMPKAGTRTFKNCLFRDRILLRGKAVAQAPNASLRFDTCLITADVELDKVEGLDDLHFDRCVLKRFVTVSSSELVRLRFDQCSLRGLRFNETNVEGEAALFCCDCGSVEFASCRFNDHVLFLETAFGDSIDFLNCDFLGRVTLADVSWPPAGHLIASMSGSKFSSTVTIAANSPPPIQFFQDAEFASKFVLRGFSDQELRKSFLTELHSRNAIDSSLVDMRAHAEKVESGCRTLRKAAEAGGDVHGEHFWHRAEIIARNARGETARSENAFSRLYGLLADYGLSIARPFVVLIASTIVFAGVYAWIGGDSWVGNLSWPDIEEGFGYSLNRTFPIGVFADEGNLWRDQLLGSGGELRHIFVRLMATGQTIFSAVLIYLGVMAIRRKFRIS